MLLAIGSAIKRNQGTGKVISGYRARAGQSHEGNSLIPVVPNLLAP
jgi:hypothetical protein